MRKALTFAAVLLIVVSMAGAATVTVDFDEDTDFTLYKRFQFLDTENSSFSQSDPLMHRQIVQLLEERLIQTST